MKQLVGKWYLTRLCWTPKPDRRTAFRAKKGAFTWEFQRDGLMTEELAGDPSSSKYLYFSKTGFLVIYRGDKPDYFLVQFNADHRLTLFDLNSFDTDTGIFKIRMYFTRNKITSQHQ